MGAAGLAVGAVAPLVSRARHLAAWGITPVTVAVAGQALSALAARAADAAGIGAGGEIAWEIAEDGALREPGVVRLNRARCAREVELAAELPDDVAAGLHDWPFAVATYAPLCSTASRRRHRAKTGSC